MSEQNSYKKIIRASSLFGFVQVGNILIAIVRSKVLALLVGPAGYGIFGLLNSTADLIRMATGFGLETSSVKIISESAQDAEQLQEKASVVLRLTIYTGIIGTLIAIVFSKYFSILVFGDISKTFAIIFIAISILFQQVANGQIAVMQGLQKLSFLAKANLYGNLAGLLITLPLYYIYKFDAIVPSIIIASVLNFGLSGYFYRKIKPGYIQGNIKQTLKGGRDILYFGAMLSISSFLPILSNYIIQVFISNTSTLAVVGLFTISMALINSYVGVLFTAMSAEYYPRLAAINNNKAEENRAVNQQSVIVMLAIVPIIVFFVGFSSIIIKLLLSEKFDAAIPMLLWGVAAMFFKSVSFSMGYVIIARGDSKVFIKTAVIFNILYVGLCITGFYLYGLEGIGFGLLIYYATHLSGIYAIIKIRYDLKINAEVLKIFLVGIMITGLALFLSKSYEGDLRYILFSILLLLSLIYSLYEIDKKINLKSIYHGYINKKK